MFYFLKCLDRLKLRWLAVKVFCLFDHPLAFMDMTYSATESINSKESCSVGILRTKRDAPPVHYSFTVESFSSFQKTKADKYESEVFEVGNVKWRLCLYPNRNIKGDGDGYISLSLMLEKDDPFPKDWYLDVEFKLFVQDKIDNKYLGVQDGLTKRFDITRTEWCFDQFLPVETFYNAANGYLIDDSCSFGAEIMVIENPNAVSSPILDKNSAMPNNLCCQVSRILRTKRDAPLMHYSFTVESFSSLQMTKVDKYESEVFEVGNVKWRLCLYPNRSIKGDGDGYISLSLMLEKDNPFPKDWYLDVEFKLFVQDKIDNKYLGVQDGQTKRFDMTRTEWCFDQFLPVETFYDAANGYLIDDCCTFGAEIVVIENPNAVSSPILDKNSAMPNNLCYQGSRILRANRDAPPVHYSFTIESFSLIQQMEVEKYESEVFEVSSEKWRLCLHPNGNIRGNGKGHISLSLELEKVNPSPPDDWQLDVELKLFVQDKINNQYLVVHDGEMKRFDRLNTEWGFDQFLSLEIFNDDSSGYLVNDCCTFGAEIFVISNPTEKCETLSIVKNPAKGSLTWKMEGFSKLDKPFYHSPEFTTGERSWKLKVYPRGYEEARGDFLSMFLQLADADKLPPKKKVGAKFKLRVLNQNQEKTLETTHSIWFSYPDVESWGERKFVRLGDLHETSKGFVDINDDTLTVEVEILWVSISETKLASAKTGIQRIKRDDPPILYTLTVESFSSLQETEGEYYESELFEFGQEKWRLFLYPNGNTKGKGNGKGHISLSLKLEKDDCPSDDWHLDVKVKFFVQDKINNKYQFVQDGGTKRFDATKTEWGIDQFVSLITLNNAANGYLVKDCCTFGVEIISAESRIVKQELLSMVKQPANGSLTWKIKDFSKLDDSSHYSPEFTAGGRSWKILVYPKGYEEDRNSLYLFLKLVVPEKLPPKKVWADFKLRVVNQRWTAKNGQVRISNWFGGSHGGGSACGWSILPLEDLRGTLKGFVMDDTLIVEAEILCLSVSKVFV